MAVIDDIYGLVPTDSCIKWMHARHTKGYGSLGVRQPDGTFKAMQAHRLSYEYHVGPIPPGLLVLHRCDNPPCINPRHLFLGTDKDNSDDKIAKGRARFTDSMSASTRKLSPRQVEAIRAIRAAGFGTQAEIAEMFGIKQPQVSAILLRQQWKSTEAFK